MESECEVRLGSRFFLREFSKSKYSGGVSSEGTG